MEFFTKLNYVRAVMSEARDGPMGSSTVHGEGGKYEASRMRFLARSGIPPVGTVMAGLVHGTAIRTLDAVPREGRVPDTDGLISWKPAIALTTQDCFPLFFAPIDPSDGATLVGIVHAGWPGIVNNISRVMIEALESQGVDRSSNLAVAIGPGIRNCCFVVRDDERGVQHYFPRYEHFVADAGTDVEGNPIWRVDLLGILLHQLTDPAELGIPRKHIAVAEECTYCTLRDDGQPRFFSSRRDHIRAANMLSAIWFRPPSRGLEAIAL